MFFYVVAAGRTTQGCRFPASPAKPVASGRDTTRMCGLFVANHRHRVQLAVFVLLKKTIYNERESK